MAEEIKIRVSADGTNETAEKLKQVEKAKEGAAKTPQGGAPAVPGTSAAPSSAAPAKPAPAPRQPAPGSGLERRWRRERDVMPTDYAPLFTTGGAKAAPAPEKRSDAIARQRNELQEMERERLALAAGGKSGEAKELEEIIAARKLALTYQIQGKMAEKEANLLAEKHVALQRQAAQAREKEAAEAKAVRDADAADAKAPGAGADDGGKSGGAKGGAAGRLLNAVTRGRYGSVGKAVGGEVGEQLAGEGGANLGKYIGGIIGVGFAAAVGWLKVRSMDIGLLRDQQIEDTDRKLANYKEETKSATSVALAGTALVDKPVEAEKAAEAIRQQLRDLETHAQDAKPNQLPTGDWFRPDKFMAKLQQFLDPTTGPNPERDQTVDKIAELTKQLGETKTITGPLTAQGRRWMEDYNKMVASGMPREMAEAVADQTSRRGDLQRMGTATQGGAKLAAVAADQRERAMADVVSAIERFHGDMSMHAATAGIRHENPNARGPGGVMVHGAHVEGVKGW